MSTAVLYFVLMGLGILAKNYDAVNAGLSWPNLLIASGVIGICLRLDKIVKKGERDK